MSKDINVPVTDLARLVRREDYCNKGWKDGLIDYVRIYSYALNPEEVKMLYEGKEPPQKKGL